jgi:hypothetical protein
MTAIIYSRDTLDACMRQAAAERPSDNWYLLADAAQFHHIDVSDWEREAQHGGWGNLLKANPEGGEADLTAWLVPLTPLSDGAEGFDVPDWVDVDAYPFATMWIQSPYTLDQITYHWQRLIDVLLPNRKVGLLRFYDACALQHMLQVVDGEQWDVLSAPVRRWAFCDRTGHLEIKTREPSSVLAAFSLELSLEQFEALKRLTHADRIILDMKAAGWLALDADQFTTFERVDRCVKVAEAHGMTDLPRQFELTAATLSWPREAIDSDALAHVLRNCAASGDSPLKMIEEASMVNAFSPIPHYSESR